MYKVEELTAKRLLEWKRGREGITDKESIGDLIEYYLNSKPATWRLAATSRDKTKDNTMQYTYYWLDGKD